jgi:glutathione synthase/RimK-type ligase-like ATP-grasp enzyme
VRVALVTAADSRDLDEDLPLLTAALADIGIEAVAEDWRDDGVDWPAYALAVVRSTWDYPAHRDEFVAWADRVAGLTELANPASVLRWNTDKHYLADLAAEGVAVVPTVFLPPGQAVTGLTGDGDVVVKPAVSAGSRDTDRHSTAAAANAHVAHLHAHGRVAMVQPYMAGIDKHGETALIYVGGEYSHALRKEPILAGAVDMSDGGVFALETLRPCEPRPAELDAAAAILAAVDATLLYARVDLVPGPDGEPLLLELELTEPSLFHAYAPGSAARFAAAIARQTGDTEL